MGVFAADPFAKSLAAHGLNFGNTSIGTNRHPHQDLGAHAIAHCGRRIPWRLGVELHRHAKLILGNLQPRPVRVTQQFQTQAEGAADIAHLSVDFNRMETPCQQPVLQALLDLTLQVAVLESHLTDRAIRFDIDQAIDAKRLQQLRPRGRRIRPRNRCVDLRIHDRRHRHQRGETRRRRTEPHVGQSHSHSLNR